MQRSSLLYFQSKNAGVALNSTILNIFNASKFNKRIVNKQTISHYQFCEREEQTEMQHKNRSKRLSRKLGRSSNITAFTTQYLEGLEKGNIPKALFDDQSIQTNIFL